MPSPTITVRLPQAQLDAIRAEAAERGETVSELVRSALHPKTLATLEPGQVATEHTTSTGFRYVRIHDVAPTAARPRAPVPATKRIATPAKPAARPAPPRAAAAVVPTKSAPEPTGFLEHREHKRRKAAAEYDAKSRDVDASGLNAHERAEAAKIKDPKQRERFISLARQSRQRRITNRTGR